MQYEAIQSHMILLAVKTLVHCKKYNDIRLYSKIKIFSLAAWSASWSSQRCTRKLTWFCRAHTRTACLHVHTHTHTVHTLAFSPRGKTVHTRAHIQNTCSNSPATGTTAAYIESSWARVCPEPCHHQLIIPTSSKSEHRLILISPNPDPPIPRLWLLVLGTLHTSGRG